VNHASDENRATPELWSAFLSRKSVNFCGVRSKAAALPPDQEIFPEFAVAKSQFH